jgi:glutathione S-transferase
MKLYDSVRAPNPRRVRIFLAEKGIEVQRVMVDLAAFEHRSEAFTKLNPFRRTPTLELDDGTIITESVAISRYFEELYPEPPLFGRTPLEKATIEMWNRRVELGFMTEVQMVFRHGHPGMATHEIPQVPEWSEANKSKMMASLRMLNDRLGEVPYIAGDAYSIADITLLCAVDFMKPTKIKVPDDHSHILRWYASVSMRKSAAL